jgi:hypothetical protein
MVCVPNDDGFDFDVPDPDDGDDASDEATRLLPPTTRKITTSTRFSYSRSIESAHSIPTKGVTSMDQFSMAFVTSLSTFAIMIASEEEEAAYDADDDACSAEW